jgi:SAM-dependent methyltransferase
MIVQREHCPVCENDVSRFLFSMRDFIVVRCRCCSHVYVKNPESDTSSDYNPQTDITKFKWRHVFIANLIKKLFSGYDTLELADIGSGYGHLAKVLEKECSGIKYYGFELSRERAGFSVSNGINVVNGYFSGPPNGYDIIVIDNVLEHVLEPKSLLRSAALSLKDGGIVIIIVPNRRDIRRFLPKWKKRHYWQPHCHINYFTCKDIISLASDSGLVVKNFDTASLPPGANFLLKVKTMLDNFGFHIGGLYMYAFKNI